VIRNPPIWTPADGAWRPIGPEGYSNMTSGYAQVTDAILYGEQVLALGSGASVAGLFQLDPAWLPDVPGKTKKIRCGFNIHTNAVAPGRDVTVALKPKGNRGGASGATPTLTSVGAAVCSAVAASAALGATDDENADSAEADFPAAGLYVMTLTTSGAFTAGATAYFRWRVQCRYA
jgi:hypothetical protein